MSVFHHFAPIIWEALKCERVIVTFRLVENARAVKPFGVIEEIEIGKRSVI
jgi:hypothetical protein